MTDRWITPQQQHALGWDIFPMQGGRKGSYIHWDPTVGDWTPTKWGLGSGWEPLTSEQVDHYWPGDGTHNVGVATGHRSGVWVLDVDVVLETEEEAREYVAEYTGVDIPQTLSVRTASGKWHFYFKMPENETVYISSSVGKLAPSVDVRGDGGMAMGVCSSVVDETGQRDYYEVATMMAPVYAPVELVERVKRKETTRDEYAPASVVKDIDPAADALAQPWIEEELQKLRDLPRPWHEGAGWHNACFEVACQVSEFANSPWCSTTPDEMRQRYLEAAPAAEHGWNPLKEWSEGVQKTEGQGRAKPHAAVPMDWFDEAAASRPTEPRQQEPLAAGESYDGPHTWDVEMNQVQDSGATFPLAMEIRKVIPRYEGVRGLAAYDGAWYFWEGSYWVECGPDDVRDFVARQIAPVKVAEKNDDGVKLKPLAPGMSKVRDVEEALATLLRRREAVDDDGTLTVYTRNGPLRIEGRERNHTVASPEIFNLSALPFDYDPSATCPQWEGFLYDIFEHDPDARIALQEWFGYFLVGNPGWLQKMFWLIGPKRSGKGTILNVARALMGNSATATSLTMLSKDFGRENLIGKRLAIIDDARDPDPRLAHSVVEFLLTLSSGGFTTISRKHRRNWDGALSTSLVAASNTIPRMPDDGGAVSSRLEVIRTRKSFIGHEDAHLGERLMTELPGILNWALAGLDRLRERERFTQAASAKVIRDEVDRGATGATPAIRDLLIAAPDDKMGLRKADLRVAIDWWSNQQEDSWRPNRLSIKSAIQAEFPDALDNQRAETYSGESIRGAWKGIVLRCRECDNPASRVTSQTGPECNLHLSNVFPQAV